MTRMIRKQIYISVESERFLKRRSRELGVSEAEIVRLALDEAERRDADARRRLALDDLLTYIRMHRTFDAPQTEWTFNREELYDERMEEFELRRKGDAH